MFQTLCALPVAFVAALVWNALKGFETGEQKTINFEGPDVEGEFG